MKTFLQKFFNKPSAIDKIKAELVDYEHDHLTELIALAHHKQMVEYYANRIGDLKVTLTELEKEGVS